MHFKFRQYTSQNRLIVSHLSSDLTPSLQNDSVVETFIFDVILDLFASLFQLFFIEFDCSFEIKMNTVFKLFSLTSRTDAIEVPSICSVAEIFDPKNCRLRHSKSVQSIFRIVLIAALELS